MAIQIELNDTTFGTEFPAGYARIVSAFTDRIKLEYWVQVYVSKTAYQAGFSPLRGHKFEIQVADISPEIGILTLIPTLYADLKTREEFANGVDV